MNSSVRRSSRNFNSIEHINFYRTTWVCSICKTINESERTHCKTCFKDVKK